MKGWEFQEIGKPLVLVEKPDPVPGEDEVVVDVKAAGICHSDIGFMDGSIAWMLAQMPIILGHEVAGTISAVGPGVDEWAVGDRVALAGLGLDAPGMTQDGGFGTKCIGKVSQLMRVADSVPFDQAAAATDAGQTSRKALRLAGVGPGSRIGIIGLGGLGLTAAKAAVLLGAEVHAAEINEEVWQKARDAGIANVVKDVAELKDLELDAILDFAGFGTTTAGAVEAVKGEGTVIQVGLGVDQATINTSTLVSQDITLRGSLGGSMADALDVLRLMSDEGLRVDTSTIPPDDIPQGLERLERGEVVGRLVAVYGE